LQLIPQHVNAFVKSLKVPDGAEVTDGDAVSFAGAGVDEFGVHAGGFADDRDVADAVLVAEAVKDEYVPYFEIFRAEGFSQ